MLKELKTQHRKILRLSAQGARPAEIADRVNMKVGSVYAILRDPLAKSFLNGLQDAADGLHLDVTRELAELQLDAVDAFRNVLRDPERMSKPDKLTIAVAKDVLDRNGHKPPERHVHAVGHFTADDLDKLVNRADAVDVSYLDITEEEDCHLAN